MRQPFGENLIAGDTWRWITVVTEDDLNDFVGLSLDGATLKYFFRAPDGTLKTFSAEVDDTGNFSFAIPVADTSSLVGSCAWSCCLFSADGGRTELARGSVNVLADVGSETNPGDTRSWTKRTLDAVCAILEGRASRVEEEYTIHGAGGGRQLRLLKPDELLKLKGDLQAAYNKELVASGQRSGNSNQIRVRFGAGSRKSGGWL